MAFINAIGCSNGDYGPRFNNSYYSNGSNNNGGYYQNHAPEQQRPGSSLGKDNASCRLFIGGLAPSVTADTLRDYFGQFGQVVHCTVPKDMRTGRSKGYGFLSYSNCEQVDLAQRSRPHQLDGRQVETKRAMPREEANNPEAHITTKKLFVGALRKDINDQLLRDYFSAYGDIVDAYIVRDSAGISRGFGFVVFDDYDPVDKVLLTKPHLLRTSPDSVSITDVKKGLSRDELASAQMREQQQQQQQHHSMGPMCGPPGPWMMGPMGPMVPMGPMGPMGAMGPMRPPAPNGKGNTSPSNGQQKWPKSPSGKGHNGKGPNCQPSYGPMMCPMGPMMGPMCPMGPMMGPMMCNAGFGYYPNQCGGYGPMGNKGQWAGGSAAGRAQPYSMWHRNRCNST